MDPWGDEGFRLNCVNPNQILNPKFKTLVIGFRVLGETFGFQVYTHLNIAATNLLSQPIDTHRAFTAVLDSDLAGLFNPKP